MLFWKKLKSDVREHVEAVARGSRSENTRVAAGRLCMFSQHCGERMVRVRVYTRLSPKLAEYRTDDESVCRICNHHFRNPSPDYVAEQASILQLGRTKNHKRRRA